MESIFRKISYIRVGVVDELVGFPKAQLRADPKEFKKIISKAREVAFGSSSPKTKFSELNLGEACRRILAQHFCHSLSIDSSFTRIISFLIFYIALPFLLLMVSIKSVRNIRMSKQKKDQIIVSDSEKLKDFVLSCCDSPDSLMISSGQYLISFEIFVLMLKSIFITPKLLFAPKLIGNMMRWLSFYNYIVEKHQPSQICVFFESTISSSLVTYWLKTKNIEHVNFMHGEVFFNNPHPCFSSFHKFVCWGKHFQSIYESANVLTDSYILKCMPLHQEIHATVDSMKNEPSEVVTLTLLLQPGIPVTEYVFEKLFFVLKSIKVGSMVYVRPHPLYQSEVENVVKKLKDHISANQLRSEVVYQDPSQVGVQNSLSQSHLILGAFSTLMLEGLLAGCKLIHVKDIVDKSTLMDRYKNSRNVLYFDEDLDTDQLSEFVNTLPVRSKRELEIIGAFFHSIPGGPAPPKS